MIRKKYAARWLCVNDKYIISYRKGKIQTRLLSTPDKVIDELRMPGWMNRCGLLARVLRLEPRCAVALNENEVLISINGKIINYDVLQNTYSVEHSFMRGMKNPLSFCVRIDEKGEREILYGEYIWNGEKGPVAVYRRKEGEWQKVYEFGSGMITHIHAIVYDDFRDCFYILTGDSDSESGIWKADVCFNKVVPLVQGKQSYRACVAFPYARGLMFLTDTPLEKNYLFDMQIKDNGEIVVQKVSEIFGPCIYGKEVNGSFYFSTTVEPDATLPTWRYRVTRKLGRGVSDRYVHIMKIDNVGSVSELYKVKKDIFPMWLFQFGNVIFPYNESNKLFVVLQATFPKHGMTLEIKTD